MGRSGVDAYGASSKCDSSGPSSDDCRGVGSGGIGIEGGTLSLGGSPYAT